MPSGFDRVIARALAKDPEERYLSAGDLGRAALAAADGRPVTESERTVARGAAAPPERAVNGHTAVTVVAAPTQARPQAAAPPPRHERTAHQPRATLPLGDRPRRSLRRRAGRALGGLLVIGAAATAVTVWATAGDAVNPQMLPGATVSDGEVESLVQDFAAAYSDEDAAALGRLLSRDVERVVPGARQRGRPAVLAAYKAQFADARTRSFELQDLATSGGATGRASGRYVATYTGEPDVTGTITFGVLRDRGEPRIALISARQDTS